MNPIYLILLWIQQVKLEKTLLGQIKVPSAITSDSVDTISLWFNVIIRWLVQGPIFSRIRKAGEKSQTCYIPGIFALTNLGESLL